jgi:hypothetical protein
MLTRSKPATAFSLLFVAFASIASAASYYIDSREGNDAHDGTAPERAWRSLARVNATAFAPGDRILLRAGSVWEGVTLHPLGSGAPDAPITIDRYGEGPAPALHGRGRVPCVLRLENQAGWEIANLELTNFTDGAPQRHRAVEIRARDAGWMRHVYLKKLFVHDVNAVSDYHNDGDTVAKSFGGIVTIIEGDARQTAWDDLRVEDCTIVDVGPMGMVMLSSWMAGHRENDPKTWFPSRNVVIRGNRFERTARNGLVVRGCVAPLIEHNLFRECARLGSGNAMFVFHCDDALVQFNESCFTRYNPGDSDASGFDSDYNCRRSVFQFNYSHDNEYGFLLVCSLGGPRARGFNDGTIVRYNISENDGGNVIRFSGTPTNTLVYNNTFYVKRDMANPRTPGAPPRIVYHKDWSGWSDGVRFLNNIVYNDCAAAVYEFGESRNNVYAHNLFFGEHPASEPRDEAKLTADPHFARPPGTTGMGRDAAATNYALRADSPAINAGAALPEHATHDFAGHAVNAQSGHVDLGAITFARARTAR